VINLGLQDKGAHLKRSDWPRPASLLAIGCLTLGIFALTAHRFTDGQGGVPLDDAWIHFQFARNLARGDGLSFNPGQPTSGSTAPLWTLLLAAVYFVGGEFPIAGQLLSAACFLAALAATYALGKRLTGNRWAAWLASVVVATNGRMVWAGLSALETCLFATLSLLAIGAHLSDRAACRARRRSSGWRRWLAPKGTCFLRYLWPITPGAPFYAIRNTFHVSRFTFHASFSPLPSSPLSCSPTSCSHYAPAATCFPILTTPRPALISAWISTSSA